MVLCSKGTISGGNPTTIYTDSLVYFGHEEGRIRKVGNDFRYDFFIRDHLGNIRMVLTDENKTDYYPAATMETASATTEEAFYGNLSATRENVPAGYPANTPPGNAKVAKVNGSGNKIGPAIILKVMAGDKFNLTVNSWYKLNGTTPGSPANPLTDLLANLNNTVGTIAGGHASPWELSGASALNSGATTFLGSQSGYNTAKPKAFINWILFDGQFNYVSGNSGFEQASVPAT